MNAKRYRDGMHTTGKFSSDPNDNMYHLNCGERVVSFLSVEYLRCGGMFFSFSFYSGREAPSLGFDSDRFLRVFCVTFNVQNYARFLRMRIARFKIPKWRTQYTR